MNGLGSVDAWRTVFLDSLNQVAGTLAGFMPQLLAALLILALGWAISKLLEKLSVRAFRRFGLDRAAEKLRISDALRRVGVESGASGIMGRLLFWMLVLAFLLTSLETLGLTAVTTTIDRLITYLPNVLAAAFILVAGLLAGRFVQNLVGSAAAVANLAQARQLGTVANGLVVIITVVLTLEQLGIETRFLIVIATTVAATFGLSMGIVLALGANKVVGHIFAGHFLRQSLPPGLSVEVRGQRGTVDRVGAVDTLFRDGEHSWSFPNGALLEEHIGR